MIKVRGYIHSRPFMGISVPQNIQNLVIRNFCETNNLFYNLSASEYSMINSYKILDHVIMELKKLDGIVAYSLFQLPENDDKRNMILNKIVKKKKNFLFCVRKYEIKKSERFRKNP